MMMSFLKRKVRNSWLSYKLRDLKRKVNIKLYFWIICEVNLFLLSYNGLDVGKVSKKGKVEFIREEMFEVVIKMLKEVDFNMVSLSLI